ncbi:hypothetical protein B0H14DRAFT_2588043 [Mycena olivaceomarginata]|nr:hypothetical protein B0H14DRAFT_2588043 [Mycena olivaceomarginata]
MVETLRAVEARRGELGAGDGYGAGTSMRRAYPVFREQRRWKYDERSCRRGEQKCSTARREDAKVAWGAHGGDVVAGAATVGKRRAVRNDAEVPGQHKAQRRGSEKEWSNRPGRMSGIDPLATDKFGCDVRWNMTCRSQDYWGCESARAARKYAIIGRWHREGSGNSAKARSSVNRRGRIGVREDTAKMWSAENSPKRNECDGSCTNVTKWRKRGERQE